MTGLLLLVPAVLLEVAATAALRAAARGRRSWYVLVVLGYLAAFSLLALSLRHGVPLGVAYGTWVAVGVALTAVTGHVLFDEPLGRTTVAGLALIGVGVLLVELGAGT